MLNSDQIRKIAIDNFVEKEIYFSMGEEDRRKLTVGVSIEGNSGEAMVYIPGVRPELGKILAIYSIDRGTGDLNELEE